MTAATRAVNGSRAHRQQWAQQELPDATVRAHRVGPEKRTRYAVTCPACPGWETKGLFREVATAWAEHKTTPGHLILTGAAVTR